MPMMPSSVWSSMIVRTVPVSIPMLQRSGAIIGTKTGVALTSTIFTGGSVRSREDCLLEDRYRWHPVRAARIVELVHGAALEIDAVVALDLVRVEIDSEAGLLWHLDVAGADLDRVGDHIADLFGVVRVDRVGELWRGCGEMHHRRGGDTKFAV